MCGRVRLSSDYSEIKIKLKFDAAAAAPNFEADFNMPPTALMLVAIRSQDGKRTPKMMKWGLIPHWAKDDKIQYSMHNARSEEFTIEARVPRRMEARPAMPSGPQWLLRMEEARSQGQEETSLCDRHGRWQPNGHGWSMVELENPTER